MLDTKQTIELQTWWLGELKAITERVLKEEEKRQERERKKTFAVLDEFRSTTDILDAYGFGCITEKKKDHLLELWDKRERMEWESPMYIAKRDLLSEFYRMAKDIIAENTRMLESKGA